MLVIGRIPIRNWVHPLSQPQDILFFLTREDYLAALGLILDNLVCYSTIEVTPCQLLLGLHEGIFYCEKHVNVINLLIKCS